MYINQMTSEQIRKMKKQEYNKRYLAKKKQEEFIKSVKTLESNWYSVMTNSARISLENRAKKLNTTIVILSIIIIILSILILIK